jgi:hypothetical protein
VDLREKEKQMLPNFNIIAHGCKEESSNSELVNDMRDNKIITLERTIVNTA